MECSDVIKSRRADGMLWTGPFLANDMCGQLQSGNIYAEREISKQWVHYDAAGALLE